MKNGLKKTATLSGHTGAVYALEKSAAAEKFFTGGGDQMVVEWDLNELTNGSVIASLTQTIYSIKLLSKKNRLVVGQATGGIHVIDLLTRKEIHLLQYHTASVFDLNYSEKHNLLFSVSGDGTFAVNNLNDFSLIKTIKLADEKLRSIAVHPDQNEVAIGCGNGSIAVFNLPSLELKKTWLAHKENFSVNVVQYDGTGNLLLSGSRDAHLNIFDVKNNYTLVTSIPAHNYAIYSIVFSADKKQFATASRDKTIKIWDAETVEVLARLDKEKAEGHSHSVNKLIWMDFKNYLVSTGDDRSVIVWEPISN